MQNLFLNNLSMCNKIIDFPYRSGQQKYFSFHFVKSVLRKTIKYSRSQGLLSFDYLDIYYKYRSL